MNTLKTINIKIPLDIAQDLDDRARLNPQWLTSFIIYHWSNVKQVIDKPVEGLTSNYSFKVEDYIHKMVKLKSVELDLPMNELLGRLLQQYYKVGR